MNDWKIFKGNNQPHDGIDELPDPPSWRNFSQKKDETDETDPTVEDETIAEMTRRWETFSKDLTLKSRDRQRGKTFRIHSDETKAQNDVINMVNAALYLRRPLMVTGKPGTGKTSLAYAVAYELQLGPVLLWPITARSTRQEGLYRYDAIARLQDVQLAEKNNNSHQKHDIGRYIQLGPLGTALLSYPRPRVLLIDEIDKSDINLPNDLLNLFEEGEFEIPELARLAKESPQVEVRTYDGMDVPIQQGRVRCQNFPLIILTNNGERDFPPAFLRRCLRLNMPYKPDAKALKEIVKAHLGEDTVTQDEKKVNQLIETFIDKRKNGDIATDQLLNAVYLMTRELKPDPGGEESLVRMLLKYLTSEED